MLSAAYASCIWSSKLRGGNGVSSDPIDVSDTSLHSKGLLGGQGANRPFWELNGGTMECWKGLGRGRALAFDPTRVIRLGMLPLTRDNALLLEAPGVCIGGEDAGEGVLLGGHRCEYWEREC